MGGLDNAVLTHVQQHDKAAKHHLNPAEPVSRLLPAFGADGLMYDKLRPRHGPLAIVSDQSECTRTRGAAQACAGTLTSTWQGLGS